MKKKKEKKRNLKKKKRNVYPQAPCLGSCCLVAIFITCHKPN